LTAQTASVSPVCETLAAPFEMESTPTIGKLAWNTFTSALTHPSAGLEVYALPAGAKPYGLAATANGIWAADPGRQKLIRTSVEYKIFLPITVR